MSASDLVIVSLLSAIAALPQNVAGFGFALVLAPLLVLFLDAGDTVVIVNILAMLSSATIVWRLRQAIAWRTAGTLFLSSFAGMPLGLFVLLVAEGRVLQILIAVAVLSGTFALARGLTVGKGHSIAIAAGIAGGILRTSTSAAGPPIIMYLQARNFPLDTFRATGSFFLMSTGAVAIVLYAATDRLDADVGLAIGAAVPGVAIGTIVGGWVGQYITETWFRRVVTVLLITTALTALVTAILG